MTGKRFGSQTVRGFSHFDGRREAYWSCVCDCGVINVASGSVLRSGRSKSCGCLTAKLISERVSLHGMRRHPLYCTWRQMRRRCYSEAAHNYKYYGGVGIKVCDRWLVGEGGKHPFVCFVEDMGDRPPRTTLDRIDPYGDYEPGNCRWANGNQQRTNRRKVADHHVQQL